MAAKRRLENITAIPLFWLLIFRLNIGECNVCVEEANRSDIPVARFCSNDMISNDTVVLDGHHANTLHNVNTCRCVASVQFGKHINKIKYQQLNSTYSPLQVDYSCGSMIKFSQLQNTQERRCQIGGFMDINNNDDVRITLLKEKKSGDTRYCFKLSLDPGNVFNLTCNRSEPNETESTEQYTSMFKNITHVSDPFLSTDDMTTVTLLFTDVINNSQHVVVVRHIDKDIFKTLYIAIGCGTSGLFIALVVGICLFYKLRQKKRTTKKDNEHADENDEYGLQYNTFYVSSNDSDVHTIVNNGRNSPSVSGIEIAYQIERNDSEIYVNNIPTQQLESDKIRNEKHDINMERDYTAIVADRNLSLPIESDSNDKNGNEKDSGHDAFLNETLKHNELSSVTHVIASGVEGCEYAVVEKPKREKCKNDVYAVVDKSRKRKS